MDPAEWQLKLSIAYDDAVRSASGKHPYEVNMEVMQAAVQIMSDFIEEVCEELTSVKVEGILPKDADDR